MFDRNLLILFASKKKKKNLLILSRVKNCNALLVDV